MRPSDRDRTVRRVLLLIVVVLLVAAAGAVWYLGPIAPVATGYAAKTTCSGHFVSGRPVADVQGDLPDNPLVPFLRTGVDDSAGTVTTTLLGLWGSTAWFTPDRGCTLAAERPDLEPAAPVPARAPLAEADLDDPTSTAVADALDAAFAEDDAEGRRRNTRAVVVLHEGAVVAERYADGFDADTPLLGWSMGKSVANAVVGRLVHDGDLDVTADGLLEAWEDDDRAAIRLEHLLHMTSGLAFDETYDVGHDATDMLFRPVDTGAFAAAKPLVHPPGTHWSYSSGTTNIICDVAAARHDAAAADLVRDLVFEPLGMTSAVMELDAAGDPVCSSFPYASARDWARFGQWFLQDGEWAGEQLLPDDWVAWSTTPVDLDTEHPYGAQWWLNASPAGDRRMPSVPADAFWASGNEGQQVVVVPSADLVVVRLGLSQQFDGIAWGLEPLVSDLVAALGD